MDYRLIIAILLYFGVAWLIWVFRFRLPRSFRAFGREWRKGR